MTESTDGKVFQVRKVFDARTMRLREELIETGAVVVPSEAVAGEDSAVADGDAPVVEANQGIVAKVKAKRRRKKKPAA